MLLYSGHSLKVGSFALLLLFTERWPLCIVRSYTIVTVIYRKVAPFHAYVCFNVLEKP